MGTYDIVRAALQTPLRRGNGIPILLRGGSGIGKTAILSEIAEEGEFHLEVLTLSLLEAVEAQGHPFLDDAKVAGADGRVTKHRQMSYAPPAWALRASQAKRAIIFLDEVNLTRKSTFAAFMRVVNEGACGSFDLGPGVRFVAACNPTDVAQAAGGVDLPMAFANRWNHQNVGLPNFGAWTSWLALGEGNERDVVGNADATEARVAEEWPDAYAKASGEVAGYLAARPRSWHVQPSPNDPAASGAWPSPRSWEQFVRARASGGIHRLSTEDSNDFEAGAIGKAHAAEFRTWLVDQDLPNAREWLAGKTEFEVDGRRLDRTQAFLISAAIEWSRLEKGRRQAELERLIQFYGGFNGRRDILVASAGLLSRGGVHEIKDEILALPLEQRKTIAGIGSLRMEAAK